MQRYFTDLSFNEEGMLLLKGEHYKHIVRVMRMQVDGRVIVVTPTGAYVTVIKEITDHEVMVKKEGEGLPSNEVPVHVTIVNGLAKGDKHDFIVQKSTELGAAKIILFKAERSIVKWDEKKGMKRIERLQKIAQQAAEQCHRTIIPEVQSPKTIQEIIALRNEYDICFFADEEEAKKETARSLTNHIGKIQKNNRVLILFGPEGGLSRSEAQLLQQADFHAVSLGPRILRTETAPLYFLSAISYAFE